MVSRDEKEPNGTTPILKTEKASDGNSEEKFDASNPILYEAALTSRFFLWRYPFSYGARFPDFVFDGISYFDLLLGDLGVRS